VGVITAAGWTREALSKAIVILLEVIAIGAMRELVVSGQPLGSFTNIVVGWVTNSYCGLRPTVDANDVDGAQGGVRGHQQARFRERRS
jgi:hypothetical protein